MDRVTGETLRAKTREARQKQAEKSIESAELRQLAEARKIEERKERTARYVAMMLGPEIGNVNAILAIAAEKGEDQTTWKKVVTTKKTEKVGLWHELKVREEINADIVADETDRVLAMRSALSEHFSLVGLQVTETEEPDGFTEEVIDYGRVFNETGRIYGLVLSWAEQTDKPAVPAAQQ